MGKNLIDSPQMKKNVLLNRRTFVKTSLQVCAGIVLSSPIVSIAGIRSNQTMSFYHTHTGERLQLDFSSQGRSPSVLEELDTFLRDFRTGKVHPIDPNLLTILQGIQQISGNYGDIEIISGYRSPKTNSLLRSKSNGVAKKSLHMQGRALDIRLKGLHTSKLKNIAASLRQGGVGYYPKSDFVHIDTGRVRCW
jgi:uncharacterized protein YcbK (DUF882 family)